MGLKWRVIQTDESPHLRLNRNERDALAAWAQYAVRRLIIEANHMNNRSIKIFYDASTYPGVRNDQGPFIFIEYNHSTGQPNEPITIKLNDPNENDEELDIFIRHKITGRQGRGRAREDGMRFMAEADSGRLDQANLLYQITRINPTELEPFADTDVALSADLTRVFNEHQLH